MYGMIHRAARQMIRDSNDAEAWVRVLNATGLEDDAFISAQVYSDEVTFNLIGAISNELGTPVPDLLVQFGRYWVAFAASSPYSQILSLAGDDIATFIGNLDRTHASVKASMPGAVLPSFLLVRADERSLQVAYRSPRQGLEPFVLGLLQGLLEHFNEKGDVTEIGPSQDGVDFLIRFAA